MDLVVSFAFEAFPFILETSESLLLNMRRNCKNMLTKLHCTYVFCMPWSNLLKQVFAQNVCVYGGGGAVGGNDMGFTLQQKGMFTQEQYWVVSNYNVPTLLMQNKELC